MTIRQPYELIYLISNILVSSDGTLVRDELDSQAKFESDFYTPEFAVSVLARITQNLLNSDKIVVVVGTPTEKGTITRLLLDSDLATYAPDIYLLLRASLLETFSILYHIDYDRVGLRYINEKDLFRIKANLGYIADYMGTEEKYFSMIEHLRNMIISFGYMQYQIDVIVRDAGRGGV